jgi:hypothetical protein
MMNNRINLQRIRNIPHDASLSSAPFDSEPAPHPIKSAVRTRMTRISTCLPIHLNTHHQYSPAASPVAPESRYAMYLRNYHITNLRFIGGMIAPDINKSNLIKKPLHSLQGTVSSCLSISDPLAWWVIK